MTEVRRSVDVPAPLNEVEEAWQQFLDGVLTGRRRLACDELACVNPVGAGSVSFENAEAGATQVTFMATLPDDIREDDLEAQRELLEGKIAHDLVMFWDYIESGAYRHDHSTRRHALRGDGPRRSRFDGSDGDSLSARRNIRS
jgi:hypothetical protein